MGRYRINAHPWRLWPALIALVLVACIDVYPTIPNPPGGGVEPTTGAVVFGAAYTTAGQAVVGAKADVQVFRDLPDGSVAYVGGKIVTTDGAGEFFTTVTLAYAGLFDANVRVVVTPPADSMLLPDTATGTVPFTGGLTDTLRVTLTLKAQ